jgi:hypothetical protein
MSAIPSNSERKSRPRWAANIVNRYRDLQAQPTPISVTAEPCNTEFECDAVFTLSTASQAHNADSEVIRWCFADAALAEAFTRKFGQL